MQETVTNRNERKSLFSTFLDVLEAREKQVLADRQLQEEKYQRITQRIYDMHERQQRSAATLRRCVEHVAQHAAALEAGLRGAGGAGGAGDAAPLAGALLQQAAALQRCMEQCVANVARIRRRLAAAQRPLPPLDAVLDKMEAELSAWTAFLQRAAEADCATVAMYDNLHNLVEEQKRCVREVSASSVYAALCGGAPHEADEADERAPAVAASTPIARD